MKTIGKEEVIKAIEKAVDKMSEKPSKEQVAFREGYRYATSLCYHFIKDYQDLHKENQELKDKYEKTKFTIIENCDLRIEIEQLKDRINKAIEYTKGLREKYFRMCVAGSNNDLSELIEILKEDNKEN